MPAREQIAVLLGDAKWVILACVVFSALLFIPDQVLELYRIIYSRSPLHAPQDFLYLHVPIIVIGVSVWFAAGQVAAATRYQFETPTGSLEFAAAVLPVLLGALPLIACTLGLIDAVPVRLATDRAATLLAGAIWKEIGEHVDDLALRLRWGAAVQAAITVALVAYGWSVALRMHKMADSLNKWHFGRLSGVGAAVVLIVSVTGAFYVWPVMLPRFVGAFGIVALFAVCILAFVINFSLLGIRYRFPFVALPCLLVIVFSLDSINDNHTIRLLRRPDPTELHAPGTSARRAFDLALARAADPALLQAADLRTAESEFSAWLDSRPDRQNYAGEDDRYPVYVVTAQGGGIYAAYQSAIFLARMQDVCPAFRHHLFAISSVSGGSVGAAVFAAALNAYDNDLLELTEDEARQQSTPPGQFDPCPAITEYRTSPRVPRSPDAPGPLERAVKRALKQDFIAPLVAAALFTDYTQWFLPWPIPSFDRARSLEYALERAGRDMMKASAPVDEVAKHNAFAGSILHLWKADGSMPALLVNATDAASGRRFVISPFRVIAPPPKGEQPASMDYKFWNPDLPARRQARDIRLSTAAFISARFPWVTPAATTVYGKSGRIRLVDGGYVDNSGVETALDLNGAIASVVAQREKKGTKPRARLSLVVLSGGDFPVRKSFSFGDLMEPVRALLSTRVSRAYVAIDRAKQDFQPYHVYDYSFRGQSISVQAESLKKARLDNRFYQLPLGWSLSDDTRAIIEGQSGRYWECLPDGNFEQAQAGLAQSDCVQMLIYYELNRALTGDARRRVGAQVAISSYLAGQESEKSRTAGDENDVIGCYQDSISRDVNFEQAGNIRALMQQWRSKYPDRAELLPYVLGTAAFESRDFRARQQSLSYTSAERILRVWGPRREEIRRMSVPDLEKYVRHPEQLAELVYGGKRGEILGNVPGSGDAWMYRPRGLAYVTGRESYRRVAASQHLDGQLMDDPDLLLIPEVNALSFIDIYFKEESVPGLAGLVRANNWTAARTVVLQNAGRKNDDGRPDEVIEKTETFAACIAAKP